MEIISYFEVWKQWGKKKIHDRTVVSHGKKLELRKDGIWRTDKKVLGGTVVAWTDFPEPYKED